MEIDLKDCPMEAIEAEIERRIGAFRTVLGRGRIAEGRRWCERFVAAREWLKLDQAQAARVLGITQAFVSMIENGHRPLSAQKYTLALIQRALVKPMDIKRTPRQ